MENNFIQSSMRTSSPDVAVDKLSSYTNPAVSIDIESLLQQVKLSILPASSKECLAKAFYILYTCAFKLESGLIRATSPCEDSERDVDGHSRMIRPTLIWIPFERKSHCERLERVQHSPPEVPGLSLEIASFPRDELGRLNSQSLLVRH